MNQLTAKGVVTMSSREIARLVQSKHGDVKRSAERLASAGILTAPLAHTPYTHPQNGQTYEEYWFNKRDSLVIVARLSPEFTAAVVDRWQELENSQAVSVPQILPEALRLAAELARRNLINWLISSILSSLGYNNERELSLGELCWWAVYSGIADAVTERMAQRALRLPDEPFLSVYRESDIVPMPPAKSILQKKVTPAVTAAKLKHEANQDVAYDQPKVLALHADPESPESFMLRPKHRRWVNEDYTRWVKTQPCEGCRRQRMIHTMSLVTAWAVPPLKPTICS